MYIFDRFDRFGVLKQQFWGPFWTSPGVPKVTFWGVPGPGSGGSNLDPLVLSPDFDVPDPPQGGPPGGPPGGPFWVLFGLSASKEVATPKSVRFDLFSLDLGQNESFWVKNTQKSNKTQSPRVFWSPLCSIDKSVRFCPSFTSF
jgi:hypothetical protein